MSFTDISENGGTIIYIRQNNNDIQYSTTYDSNWKTIIFNAVHQ